MLTKNKLSYLAILSLASFDHAELWQWIPPSPWQLQRLQLTRERLRLLHSVLLKLCDIRGMFLVRPSIGIAASILSTTSMAWQTTQDLTASMTRSYDLSSMPHTSISIAASISSASHRVASSRPPCTCQAPLPAQASTSLPPSHLPPKWPCHAVLLKLQQSPWPGRTTQAPCHTQS